MKMVKKKDITFVDLPVLVHGLFGVSLGPLDLAGGYT
jgi:hypothetical protein